MEQNRVVNIVNFVRACEPRCEMDLFTPVVEEIRWNKKYGFENTFLLQYDTMCSKEFVDLFLTQKDEQMELGVWLEVVRPLVDAAGLTWNGRWDWDWHVNPGFLNAYTREEKEKLIDKIMEKFHTIFGYYPKSAGCWLLDSDSIRYMKDTYGIEAFCICREQWGTDGYTYWGGYYNGAYFPSKNHFLHPAQTKEQQMHVPVFRMLGIDPIYSYYEKRQELNLLGKNLYSLEPTWYCGQNEAWVDWYFKNFIELEDMGYSYTQTGQENSFGWEDISKGLPMQMEYLDKLQKEGKIRIEKLCDSGRAFTEKYEMTPATVYSALTDWARDGKQSVWYNCKNYRFNVFCDGENVFLRDIHKFCEKIRDTYLDAPCKEQSILYDTLPIMDGLNFTDENTVAGIYFGKGKITRTYKNGQEFLLGIAGEDNNFVMKMTEERIDIIGENEFSLEFVVKKDCQTEIAFAKQEISYLHRGMKYKVIVTEGFVDAETKCLSSLNKKICFKMSDE